MWPPNEVLSWILLKTPEKALFSRPFREPVGQESAAITGVQEATLAERFGKEVTFWLNQRETVEYIAALASQLGKINSYTVQELNLIKQLESSSAASRAALLAFAKKTGLVHVQHGFMLIQGVGILLAQLGSDLRCHHPALIGY